MDSWTASVHILVTPAVPFRTCTEVFTRSISRSKPPLHVRVIKCRAALREFVTSVVKRWVSLKIPGTWQSMACAPTTIHSAEFHLWYLVTVSFWLLWWSLSASVSLLWSIPSRRASVSLIGMCSPSPRPRILGYLY